MAEIWFSSDPHFHHANIIKYADRPFENVVEMDDFIVEEHNKIVRPQDHWYCLGDVTMERDSQGLGLTILKRMNGHKRLIMGNHDHYHVKHYLNYFDKVMAMQRIDAFWFMHVPCHPSDVGSNHAIVHGHIHQNPSPPPAVREWEKDGTKYRRVVPYINVSMEAINYHPVNLEWLRNRTKELVDNFERGV